MSLQPIIDQTRNETRAAMQNCANSIEKTLRTGQRDISHLNKLAPNTDIPLPETKQLTWPSIESQKQFWINKKAKENNAANEAREDIPPAVKLALHVVLNHVEPGWENCVALLNQWLDSIATPQIPHGNASATADPKPKDFGGNELPDRIEANEDLYEVERNDFDRGDLRDEGRNPDGSGMSYGERNA